MEMTETEVRTAVGKSSVLNEGNPVVNYHPPKSMVLMACGNSESMVSKVVFDIRGMRFVGNGGIIHND